MNDFQPLLNDGANEFEARLLRAGRRDAPPARSRRRVLAGLGLGGVFSTITVATGAEASVRAWLVAAGTSAVGAIAIWSGIGLLSTPEPREAPRPSAPAVHQAPAAAAPAARIEPLESPPSVAPEAPAVRPAARAARPSVNESLSGEIAALDGARRALAAGSPTRTLSLLDEYARDFPKRHLEAEATVLRIEALSAAGDRARARRVGESFLRSYPKSPYEKRVRSLIDAE